MSQGPYLLISLDADETQAASLSSALEEFGQPAPISVSARRMGKAKPWRIEALFDAQPDMPALTAFLRDIGHDGIVAQGTLPDADWIALVEAGLPPIRTRRFFVRGPHVALPADIGARRPLMIEAGLAFGTGHHMSTLGCLLALEGIARAGHRPSRVLDLGTGTGLLAFAAAHLWRGARIIASDIDPVAVDVTAANARLNGLGPRVRVLTATGYRGPAIRALRPFDLIMANILAGPLVRLSAETAGHLAPGGRLVLAGLLDEQANAVASAHRTAGLRLLAGHDHEGWTTLIFCRP